jgi:hypothetical protein
LVEFEKKLLTRVSYRTLGSSTLRHFVASSTRPFRTWNRRLVVSRNWSYRFVGSNDPEVLSTNKQPRNLFTIIHRHSLSSLGQICKNRVHSQIDSQTNTRIERSHSHVIFPFSIFVFVLLSHFDIHIQLILSLSLSLVVSVFIFLTMCRRFESIYSVCENSFGIVKNCRTWVWTCREVPSRRHENTILSFWRQSPPRWNRQLRSRKTLCLKAQNSIQTINHTSLQSLSICLSHIFCTCLFVC